MKPPFGGFNPHGKHATFPHLPSGEGFQGSLSLQWFEIILCTAWIDLIGIKYNEFYIKGRTLLWEDHEAHILQGDPIRLKSGVELQKIHLIIVVL